MVRAGTNSVHAKRIYDIAVRTEFAIKLAKSAARRAKSWNFTSHRLAAMLQPHYQAHRMQRASHGGQAGCIIQPFRLSALCG